MSVNKKPVRRRIKIGLAGAPTEDFVKMKRYFHSDLENKEYSKVVKEYVRKNYSKPDASAILANPEYRITMFSHVAACCHWKKLGKEFPDNYNAEESIFNVYFSELIKKGNAILKAKAVKDAAQGKAITRSSPAQLLEDKVNGTILTELDELEDEWIEGKKTDFDIYKRFNAIGLKAAAVPQVKEYIDCRLTELVDAYDKKCEQLVEAFAHLTRRENKRRIKVWENMLSDLDKFKTASKVTRKVKAPKKVDAPKQVKDLKYKTKDINLKIVSVNPETIIGAVRLIAINCKYNSVTEYFADSPKGFEVKGTSLKNFDVESSRTKTMRKPEEFLGNISKTQRQFNKLFEALGTKQKVPNGRFNDETVIVRVD